MSTSLPATLWVQSHLPELTGKQALVTGGASGLGFATAQLLASRGATVTLADRNVAGGEAAVLRLRQLCPAATLRFLPLDLSDLDAVNQFAERLRTAQQPLDLLVNNAGILPPLARQVNAAGHELTFAISVLGHFALTAGLLPLLRQREGARVVWVSSLVQRFGTLQLDDLHSAKNYNPEAVYNHSKLASLMLAMELDVRLRAAAIPLLSVAAHPGVARTRIGDSRRGQTRQRWSDVMAALAFRLVMRWFSQSQEGGALPIAQAAAGAVASGEFWGPDGFAQMRGLPTRVRPCKVACDTEKRRILWQHCETLTKVRYDL